MFMHCNLGCWSVTNHFNLYNRLESFKIEFCFQCCKWSFSGAKQIKVIMCVFVCSYFYIQPNHKALFTSPKLSRINPIITHLCGEIFYQTRFKIAMDLDMSLWVLSAVLKVWMVFFWSKDFACNKFNLKRWF